MRARLLADRSSPSRACAFRRMVSSVRLLASSCCAEFGCTRRRGDGGDVVALVADLGQAFLDLALQLQVGIRGRGGLVGGPLRDLDQALGDLHLPLATPVSPRPGASDVSAITSVQAWLSMVRVKRGSCCPLSSCLHALGGVLARQGQFFLATRRLDVPAFGDLGLARQRLQVR